MSLSISTLTPPMKPPPAVQAKPEPPPAKESFDAAQTSASAQVKKRDDTAPPLQRMLDVPGLKKPGEEVSKPAELEAEAREVSAKTREASGAQSVDDIIKLRPGPSQVEVLHQQARRAYDSAKMNAGAGAPMPTDAQPAFDLVR